MKRILSFLLVFFIGLVGLAQAEWLVCDPPSETIASCEVEVTVASSVTVQPGICSLSGADYTLLDLSGFGPGNYKFRARWTGLGGWPSAWSDPFDASKPGKPGGVFRIRK